MPIREQFKTEEAFQTALRDYFAAKAMAALINSGTTISRHTEEGVLTLPARIAIPPLAYEYADAMLAARKEPQ